MDSNSTEIEKSTVALGIESDIDKEEASPKVTSNLMPKFELHKKNNVFNEIGYENVFINKSEKEDDISTDETSREVDDMSSLLESNTLALSKNQDAMERKTEDQNKDEKNNHIENKANISTATQDDPADVLVKNPK